jgi:hypothetical protein
MRRIVWKATLAASALGFGALALLVATSSGPTGAETAPSITPIVTIPIINHDAPAVTAISPAGGPPAGGTVVTITGANFAGPGSSPADVVLFGSTAATAVSCSSTTSCTATSPAGAGTVDVTVNVGTLSSLPTGADKFSYAQLILTPPIIIPHGYWLVGSDGGIFSFGDALFHGSMGGKVLQRPVVGITPTTDRGGYWLVAADGGVFSFGDTTFYNSLPGEGFTPVGSHTGKPLVAPVVGMVPSGDDGGYFMVGGDGGVFTFGDARFEGSCPDIGGCSGAAVAVMPDATGNGYWLVTTTGHVYNFGDAPALGSPGPQSTLVTSAVRTPDGLGYYVLFANGTVTTYGDATNLGGPTGAVGGSNPASAIFATSTNKGYWVSSADGVVFPYGDAPNDGGISGSTHLNGPIIAASGS